MRQLTATLALLLVLGGNGQADSYPQYTARRVPDSTGEFCAVIVRTQGPRHAHYEGPVEVQIVRRGRTGAPFAPLPPIHSRPGLRALVEHGRKDR
jgi:hypothetical protein